jgi:hypothetical protein
MKNKAFCFIHKNMEISHMTINPDNLYAHDIYLEDQAELKQRLNDLSFGACLKAWRQGEA